MRILPLLLLCACADQQQYETFEIQPNLPTPIDVLVVLDDTTAMTDHLPRRGVDQLGILALIYNGAPDIRVAVTTGTTGTLRTSTDVPAGFIEHRLDFADGTLHTNYSGSLQTAAASLTNVGVSKTEPNALLAAAQHGLETPGFLRDGVGTGMFMVTASDDASVGDLSTYASAIANGKRAMVAVVNAGAVPRLGAFADGLPFQSFWPMETYDMSALTVLAQLWKPTNRDSSCLPVRPAVVDGDYDCEIVTEHEHITLSQARCEGDWLSSWNSAKTCWHVLPDESCSSGLALVLGGPFHYYQPRIIGRCATN